ncbi:helix-turn-helix transcriptional regulator [Rhodovulum euryhalinum]|uniref:LuxR family transcriptional regulator n=1 Tax=Rhodovulum euryhalinum TaxID=35805 RepID=A0A4R2L014_9RHOB|nr:LuxR family transcriptional regulator [Rhodovulum euryhalinum]TCO72335.1 LuxR family transcriptional regulator [Rhodovulum euryhalinum]
MSLIKRFSDRLTELAPAGCYVALRVGFSYPAEELNRLPEAWVQHYTAHGLVVHDPVMKWAYAHTGTTTWDRIGVEDPRGVLKEARRHGLRHGAVTSVLFPDDQGRRSYGNFVRSDRPFSAVEMHELLAIVTQLHKAGAPPRKLTRAETEALRLQANGLRLKQISAELDISMSAVKARLANAKRKLGAQTPSQAASIARSRGVI